jgi:hypothetical protein
MKDPRNHVLRGQPLRLAAEQVNSLNSLMRVNTGFNSGPVDIPQAAKNVILCRNSSGADVDRWGVLEISGVVFDPGDGASAEATFQSTPCVTGVTPTDSSKPFVIAVEPIASGAIGRVSVAGVVQCKLDVAAAGDVTAGAKSGSLTELKTGSGPARIIWKQGGTGGGKWALVAIGGGESGGGPRLGTVSATWAKGATATVTQIKADGSALSPTVAFTATNHFAAVTVASGTKKVLCVFVGDRWLLVAAEC